MSDTFLRRAGAMPALSLRRTALCQTDIAAYQEVDRAIRVGDLKRHSDGQRQVREVP
jgi:hypothetical protein